MRAAWIFAYNLIDRIVPNGLSLYMLGAGLLAAGLGHVLITLGFLDALHLLLILALLLAGLGNTALAERRPRGAFRFVHVVRLEMGG